MNILAVFAHPDDELGCAATMAKHAARGDNVTLVWTTSGENASQFGGMAAEEVKRIREGHARDVSEHLGVQWRLFDLGDTRLTGGRAEAMVLAAVYAELQPDAIITWDDYNPHPDHRMTAKAAYDAITLARIPKVVEEAAPGQGLSAHRKPVSFYQYVAPESNRPIVHVDVTGFEEQAAWAAQYYSDFYKWEFGRDGFLNARGQAGRAVGVKFAERFTLRRAHHPPLEHLV
ncbi:MAG TPA: PIG-L deacetylase family protein [Deinococcales bacterium]|nr:PIG-L deacetylase family protein [Deinococcales bacterium]